MTLLQQNAQLIEQVRDGATVDHGEDDTWGAWPWKPTVSPGKPQSGRRRGGGSASALGRPAAEGSDS